MSSIEEISDDNRWSVYLKSAPEDKEENEEEKRREMKGEMESKSGEQREPEQIDSDSTDEEDDAVPLDAMKPQLRYAKTALPEKSKEKYEALYNNFLTWMENKGWKSLSEDTLLEYFMELSKEKKPSTLWAQHSMLKATIYGHHKIDITSYNRVFAFLKKTSVGYKSKAHKTFTPCEIEKFLNEAPDSQYLVMKVVVILGIVGDCKRTELVNITLDDVKDSGSKMTFHVTNSEGDSRSFTISGQFYSLIKKYLALRPKKVTTNRFFLTYYNGKCVQVPIGINALSAMSKRIATFLNLSDSDSYKFYGFRQTRVELADHTGVVGAELKHNCGCKNAYERQTTAEDLTEAKRKMCEQTESVFFNHPLLNQSNIESPPSKRRKNEDTSDVDPLATSSSKYIERVKYVPTAEEVASARQINSQSNSVAKVLKLSAQPAVQPQVKNIASTSSPQQRIQPKSLILRKVPLQTKEAAPVATNTPSKQQTTHPGPKTAPQRPIEVRLKWNNHHNNMQNSFPSLLNSEDFVDVTLACEGKSLKCHKVILSSCSDYLATLLRENPCPHPIILMKDLEFWQIEALVTFMYKGEVNVVRDKLPDLISAARILQIKGLVGPFPSKIQKMPTLVSQTKPASSPLPTPTPKPTATKNLVPPKNSSPATQPVSRPVSKRLLNPKLSRPLAVRFPVSKPPTPAPSVSPVVKSEPLNAPLSPVDIFPEDNDDSSTLSYENLMTLHKDNDPGGKERVDSVDDGIEFEAIEDINDIKEQMEFILPDFLKQEQDILHKIDDDSSSSSTTEIKDTAGNEPYDRNRDDDDEIKLIQDGET